MSHCRCHDPGRQALSLLGIVSSLLLLIKIAKCVMSTKSQRREPVSWTYLHTDYYRFSFGLVIATDVHDFQLSFKRAVNCPNYTTGICSESLNDNKDSLHLNIYLQSKMFLKQQRESELMATEPQPGASMTRTLITAHQSLARQGEPGRVENQTFQTLHGTTWIYTESNGGNPLHFIYYP